MWSSLGTISGSLKEWYKHSIQYFLLSNMGNEVIYGKECSHLGLWEPVVTSFYRWPREIHTGPCVPSGLKAISVFLPEWHSLMLPNPPLPQSTEWYVFRTWMLVYRKKHAALFVLHWKHRGKYYSRCVSANCSDFCLLIQLAQLAHTSLLFSQWESKLLDCLAQSYSFITWTHSHLQFQ